MIEIEKLKAGDAATIEKLYLNYKNGFIQFAGRYNLRHDDLLDVYQDAFVALIENAKKGKLDELKSELKTYLYSIGKYMIFGRIKKDKTQGFEDISQHFEWEEIDNNEDSFVLIENNLEKLGSQCYSILKMFYYENLKLEEILNRSSYTSKDVLKSQKARCLKQLKDLVAKN